MTQISRLKDAEITQGEAIIAEDIGAELDQLVSESNAQDTRITDLESDTLTTQKTFNNGLKTDTISEKTSATGVTVDSVRLKDGMAQVSGTPASAGEVGYTGNHLRFHNGTDALYVPESNSAMPIELTSPAAGQVLGWDGSNWVNTVGIVQVVGSPVVSGSSTSNTTATDVTGASLAITPTNANNKILVLMSWQFTSPLVANENVQIKHQILRDATNISGADAFIGGTDDGDGGQRSYGSHAFTYLDSPATTSEVTYKLQQKYVGDPGGVVTTSRVTIVLVEISA